MSEVRETAESTTTGDLGEYCRQVEDHLTRVNAGHLVRIVGPGFALVRQWAESGVPLSVVYRGIDLKAERHREGSSRRPLRIEFCAADVQAIFDQWRRAVGVMTIGDAGPDGAETPDAEPERKRKSLSRHLDRAIDRLSRAAAVAELPEGLRQECARVLQALATLRESSARIRGAERLEADAALGDLDLDLARAARQHAPPAWIEALRAEAAADLAPFRSRLGADAWERSLQVTMDRLLRDRFGLPALAP